MYIIFQAIIAGLASVFIGAVIAYILSYFMLDHLPASCEAWNKHHIMEGSLFLTGFFVHLFRKFFRIP